MFRLGKSDTNSNNKESRKGSAGDIDIVDSPENSGKLYMPLANRGKRTSGWSTAEPKEKSPKPSENVARKLSNADSNSMFLSDDEKDEFDDYVADISDATMSGPSHLNSSLLQVMKESDSRVNFSSLSLVDDMDLSVLTKHLHPLEDVLDEENQAWTWDSLFTKVASELRVEGKYK
ncbi:hypothetical protein WDU94_015086 [Cyamophila willieti]